MTQPCKANPAMVTCAIHSLQKTSCIPCRGPGVHSLLLSQRRAGMPPLSAYRQVAQGKSVWHNQTVTGRPCHSTALRRNMVPLALSKSNSALQLDPDIEPKALQAAYDLKTRGWAVVPGVLPETTCAQYVDGLWAWLESLGTGIDRHNPDSWRSPAWPSAFRGIINTLAVSHQPFVWHVRKHARLRQVFAALWGTNELLSSFDSINCSPPRVNGSGGASWVHTDQGPNRQGPICIQGALNMSDTSATTTGTLLLKDGSHHGHARFWREVCQKEQQELSKIPDFYIFNEHEIPFYEQFPTVTPDGPAGSLFLWDSRTAHANVSPEVSSDFRHVVYTCFQPKEFATPDDLILKRTAYEEYRVTTHWPAYNVALFPEGGSAYIMLGSAEYYKAHEQDGSVPRHAKHHDRGDEDDALLRQLAGVEPYPAHAVHQAEPLLQLSCEQLESRLNTT